MIILLPIFFMIFILIADATSVLVNKKIKNYVFPLIFISGLQLLSQFFINLLRVEFQTFRIVTYVASALMLASFIGYIAYELLKYKKANETLHFKLILPKFKENLSLYIGLVGFVIFTLFQFNNFEDTQYYIGLSKNYEFGTLPSVSIDLSPGAYYVYAVLGEGFIPTWYSYFSPIIFVMVVGSTFNDFTKEVCKESKNQWLYTILMNIFVFAFLAAMISTISSGNLMVSGCLLAMLMMFIYKKEYSSIPLALIFVQFFSSTGALLTVLASACMLLYFFIFYGFRGVFKNLPFLILSNFTTHTLILQLFGKTVPATVTSGLGMLSLAFSSALVLIAFLFVLLNKFYFVKKQNKFLDFNLIENDFIYKKWTKIVLISLFLISMILTTVYFAFIYYMNFVYSMIPYLLFGIPTTTLICFNLWKIKKENESAKFLTIMILFTFAVTATSMLLWMIGINNGSIWRIMFLLPTAAIGENSLNVIVILIVLSLFFHSNFKIKLNEIIKIDFKKFNPKIVKPSFAVATSIASFIPLAIIAGIPAMSNYGLVQFSGNVQKNIFGMSYQDALKFNSISKKSNNLNWSYAFDNAVGGYLLVKSNVTFKFYDEMWKANGVDNVSPDDKRDNPLNSLGFYRSRTISGLQKDQKVVNQSLTEFKTMFNDYIATTNWHTSTDFLILYKGSDYYNASLMNQNPLADTKTFNDYTILAKDNTILSEFISFTK
ncbi:MAG: hypothetical protein ACRC4M_01950 [Mycoplasma sp.]